MVSLAASSAPARDQRPGLGDVGFSQTDGAAPTVSTPTVSTPTVSTLTLSKEVARLLPAGGG